MFKNLIESLRKKTLSLSDLPETIRVPGHAGQTEIDLWVGLGTALGLITYNREKKIQEEAALIKVTEVNIEEDDEDGI